MRRKWSSVFVLVVPVVLLAASCSDDGGTSADTLASSSTTASTVDMSGECETGTWVSTGMTFPGQAAITVITPTGGGDGMDIDINADGTFQIDFGPMNPATASFDSAGSPGTMSASFSGVGKGIWTVDAEGARMASFENFNTAKALVTLTLGETVPPIFDNTLQDINDDRMLDGQRVGVFTFTECTQDTLTMTTPFPAGTVEIIAARA
ncbi:MAG: hypothetical protein HY828_09645 [Actinobacteria bacterium]|nr:hypothetical protein [Actinomycetota bacterium]